MSIGHRDWRARVHNGEQVVLKWRNEHRYDGAKNQRPVGKRRLTEVAVRVDPTSARHYLSDTDEKRLIDGRNALDRSALMRDGFQLGEQLAKIFSIRKDAAVILNGHPSIAVALNNVAVHG
jgi:hypothetical protein